MLMKRGLLFTMTSLPSFLRNMIASPPRAGHGVHDWLFRVSRQLHAHLPASEIVRLLETRVRECGRYVSPSEIASAVQNSISCAWERSKNSPASKSAPKWPKVNQEQREAIIRAHDYALAD